MVHCFTPRAVRFASTPVGLARTSRRCVGRVADLVSTVPAMNSWADRVIAEILDSVDALVADPHRQAPSTGTDAEEER